MNVKLHEIPFSSNKRMLLYNEATHSPLGVVSDYVGPPAGLTTGEINTPEGAINLPHIIRTLVSVHCANYLVR